MDNLFRQFFGLPTKNHNCKPRRDEFDDSYSHSIKDYNNENDDDDGSNDDFAFPFSIFRQGDIIKQFEGVFASLDAITQSMEHGEFPALSPAPDSFQSESDSARDQMLKDDGDSSRPSEKSKDFLGLNKHSEPRQDHSWSRMWKMWQSDDVSNSSKQDTDLDSVVKSQGLESILPSDKSRTEQDHNSDSILQRFNKVKPFSHSSTFSSTYSFRGIDGKSESIQTIKDTEGNVVTRTTKSVDGETWTEVVKKDRSGNIIESHSDKLSSSSLPLPITDKERASLDSRWQGKASSHEETPSDMIMVQPGAKSDFNSIFRNIFGVEFPRNW